MSRLKRGILWVLIGLCGIGIAMIILPMFIPPSDCSSVSRILAGSRSIGTAVEVYMVDHSEPPNTMGDLYNGGYLIHADDRLDDFRITRITSDTVTINYHGPTFSGISASELQKATRRRVTISPGKPH